MGRLADESERAIAIEGEVVSGLLKVLAFQLADRDLETASPPTLGQIVERNPTAAYDLTTSRAD
jgi:hypothetical protein